MTVMELKYSLGNGQVYMERFMKAKRHTALTGFVNATVIITIT